MAPKAVDTSMGAAMAAVITGKATEVAQPATPVAAMPAHTDDGNVLAYILRNVKPVIALSASKPKDRTIGGFGKPVLPDPQGGTRQLKATVRWFLDPSQRTYITASINEERWKENGVEKDKIRISLRGIDYVALDESSRNTVAPFKAAAFDVYGRYMARTSKADIAKVTSSAVSTDFTLADLAKFAEPEGHSVEA